MTTSPTTRREAFTTAGRDHHVSGYSLFMAGGGFKGGTAYGETDEFGANAAVKPRQDQLQGKRNVHFMASGSAVLAKQVAEAITRELPKPASK